MHRITSCSIHRIPIPTTRNPLRRIRHLTTLGDTLPPPDFIIAAGHTTHLPLIFLSRMHHSKSVVLMKPSLPLSWFDYCIAPDHDFSNGANHPGLILTRGALNRITAASKAKSDMLILIGGPSKIHAWDSPALIESLTEITSKGAWILTDSRRTPGEFLQQIRTALPAINVRSHTQTPPDWLPEQLQNAREVWVTEDSVSMIYEALTSGAHVGLLPVPRKKSTSRVMRGIDRLINDGYLTPYAAWQRSRQLKPPPSPLQEADQAARHLMLHFKNP